MEESKVLFNLNLFGMEVPVTDTGLYSVIVQWTIMAFLILLAFILTRNLKKKPGKVQTVVEMFVQFMRATVDKNMGKEYKHFVPFIGTLSVYLLLLNLTGLFGIKPPTADLSTTLGLAIISFIVINAYSIRKNGLWGYTKAFGQPMALMFPMNLLERCMYLFTLTLRMFGNMLVGTMVLELVYDALGNLNFFAQIGVPIILHGYFDLFDGAIQTFVFVLLTMINIKMVNEE